MTAQDTCCQKARHFWARSGVWACRCVLCCDVLRNLHRTRCALLDEKENILCLDGHFLPTQHQEDERVSRPPCRGCLKCWINMCHVFKKLRKFDDAQLERQFVQHHYRPPMYFCFITVIAVFIALGAGVWFWFASHGNIIWPVVYTVWGIAFFLCGIGLIVATRIRHIRENHWEKVALSTAVLVFTGAAVAALGYESTPWTVPLMNGMNGDPSNDTYITCPGLLSAVRPAVNSAGSHACGEIAQMNSFASFLLLWVGPLCLPVFGLDVRRYAPLLITEVTVSSVAITVIYLRSADLYPHYQFLDTSIYSLSFFFSFLVLASLLWSSLSSESAARVAWIRQQNW